MFHALDYILSKQKFFFMPVLYNINIWVGNKPKYVKIWYEHGAKIISDFLNKDGNVFITFICFEKKKYMFKAWQMIVQCKKEELYVSFSKSCQLIDLRKDYSPFILFLL